MLASRILVLTSHNITLFPHPQLLPTDNLDDVTACHSPVDALWNWPLEVDRIGPFRRFSCTDYHIPGDVFHLNARELFFYLTGRHLYAICPQDLPSGPMALTRLVAKGISLPQSLRDTTRVLLGPSGKRGVWIHALPDSTRIQLVDFWGADHGPQVWAKSLQIASPEVAEVIMKEDHGFLTDPGPIPQMFTLDEATGRLVFAVADTLVIYQF